MELDFSKGTFDILIYIVLAAGIFQLSRWILDFIVWPILIFIIGAVFATSFALCMVRVQYMLRQRATPYALFIGVLRLSWVQMRNREFLLYWSDKFNFKDGSAITVHFRPWYWKYTDIRTVVA